MRDAGRKREIRRTRDFIRIRLVFRREKLHRYKIIPNEIKNKSAIIIPEKAFIRVFNFVLNLPLNTRKAFKKYFRNE